MSESNHPKPGNPHEVCKICKLRCEKHITDGDFIVCYSCAEKEIINRYLYWGTPLSGAKKVLDKIKNSGAFEFQYYLWRNYKDLGEHSFGWMMCKNPLALTQRTLKLKALIWQPSIIKLYFKTYWNHCKSLL